MISIELKKEKVNLDPIDSFYGSWVVQLIDNQYYVYEALHTTDMSFEDKTLIKREIFNKTWQKTYQRIIKLYPSVKTYLDELVQGFEDMVSGKVNNFKHKSPWLAENDELYWIHDQLKVVERNSKGKAKLIIGSSFDVSKSQLYMETINELSLENRNLNIANKRAVGLSKMLVWRIEFEDQNIPEHVYANNLYGEVLGIDFVKKNIILYNDLLNTTYPDKEGEESMSALLKNFEKANTDNTLNYFNQLVKHRNLKTQEPVYLDHYTSIEERFPDGSLKAVGGYILNITEKYNIAKQNEKLQLENVKLVRAERLAINSGRVMVWILDNEDDESNKYFYGNDLMFDTLGLTKYPNNKFLLDEYVQTIYDKDSEGQELKRKYIEIDNLVIDNELDFYEKVLVKHKNLITNQIVYLEHAFEVEKRYSNGRLKTRGGYFTDVTIEIQVKKKNQYLIEYDAMTDILNRNSFEKFIESNYMPTSYSLIIADIDGLKFINDAFGHINGDKAIKFVAEVITNIFNSNSRIYRIGGDEFAIICDETNDTVLFNSISRVRERINMYELTNNFKVSISLGYEIAIGNTKNFSDVFIDAENLMYRRKLSERSSRKSKTMDTIIETLNQKTEETKDHCYRLGESAVNLMRKLGYNRSSDQDDMKLLCNVHDIGKITISEEILSKSGLLTKEEYKKIKKHAEAGYKIVKNIVDSDRIAFGVLHHHERYDGTGYPFGLKGDEIPVFSRILSICDAYDVMKYGRSYCSPKTDEEILKDIERNTGTQFDPCFASKFIEILSDKSQTE
jgi:diguanylate cyclase (GGDEF)-like protein